jgi:hypothetical protein
LRLSAELFSLPHSIIPVIPRVQVATPVVAVVVAAVPVTHLDLRLQGPISILALCRML